MSSEYLKEGFKLIDRKSICEILSRKVFRGPFEDPVMGNEEAHRIILKKYPDFEFSGLRADQEVDFAVKCKRIEDESQRVVALVRSGKRNEAFKLAREIKLISDPNVSISEVYIGEAIKAYYGNLEGAADLLGFKDLRNGVSWIDFIVRTWGFTPEDIANL